MQIHMDRCMHMCRHMHAFTHVNAHVAETRATPQVIQTITHAADLSNVSKVWPATACD